MVFEHILWMFVCLRLLGSESADPSPGMTLFAYAAELELQYCRRRISAGAAANSEAWKLTRNLIGILAARGASS